MISFEYKKYEFFADDMWFMQNSCMKWMRTSKIKFHFRLIRVANKYNLSVDELHSIWWEYVRVMSTKQFFNIFNKNEEFRNDCIKELEEAKKAGKGGW